MYLSLYFVLKMRGDFGLNTDILETNILNLVVVLGVVVTVVGDAVRALLDQRRESVLFTLQEADRKVREAQLLLEEANKAVETARFRSQEIRIQAVKSVEQERYAIQQQLKEDLQRLKDRSSKTVQLERRRTIQIITKKVADLALTTAENILLISFGSRGPSNPKQKELNEIRVTETFLKLEVFSS